MPRWLVGALGLLIGISIGATVADGSDEDLERARAKLAEARQQIQWYEDRQQLGLADPPSTPGADTDGEARADSQLPADAARNAPLGQTIPGEGMFVVGRDIQAGRYRTQGSAFCYWERLRDRSGAYESIIDRELATRPVVVTIKKSDEVFHTTGCPGWQHTTAGSGR
ncbi:MAG: hypothetical protein ACRDPT_13015 [Streptomycetales bacterium]